MGATTSGYFAASYFFHICIEEGCALFFFAGGWSAALSTSGTRLVLNQIKAGETWCRLCRVGLQSRNSSDGLLKGAGVLILNLLLIPIAKIVQLIKRVLTLIVITVIRHGVGHI